MLYKLAAQGLLPDDLVSEGMQVLSATRRTEQEQQYYALIEQLLVDTVRPADFIVQWMQIRLAHIPKPKRKPQSIWIRPLSGQAIMQLFEALAESMDNFRKIVFALTTITLFLMLIVGFATGMITLHDLTTFIIKLTK